MKENKQHSQGFQLKFALNHSFKQKSKVLDIYCLVEGRSWIQQKKIILAIMNSNRIEKEYQIIKFFSDL